MDDGIKPHLPDADRSAPMGKDAGSMRARLSLLPLAAVALALVAGPPACAGRFPSPVPAEVPPAEAPPVTVVPIEVQPAEVLPAETPSVPVPPAKAPPTDPLPAEVLLAEDFEGENDSRYALNYTDFTRWEVIRGSVDLVGRPPYDDFLPATQGMYVDLDGTTKKAGTLRSRTAFDLRPGRYRLVLKMAGSPRPNQPPNTMVVSVGGLFRETVTLDSYAPLQTLSRTFHVRSPTSAHLLFDHHGGDDYGIFIDDIRLERL